MIKAVVFDFGQTLVDSAAGFRAAEKMAQFRIFAQLEGIAWERFIDMYRQKRTSYQAASNFSRGELWESVFGAFGVDASSLPMEEWEQEYWDCVEERTILFPESLDVLRRLKQSFQLAIITNTQGQTRSGAHRIREFSEFGKLFDTVIIAGESGVPPKPAPAPFRICLERLGARSEEAVYVGDDIDIDIDGALNVGMHAVWLKHRSVTRNWPNRESSAPVIFQLDELLDLDMLQSPD